MRRLQPLGRYSWRLRALPLVLLGALAVHRLEYLTTGPVQSAHGEATQDVHAYLQWLLPLAGLALMLGLVEFFLSAGRRPSAGPASSRAVSWKRMWALITASLVGVYAGQEMAEGLILTGDPLALLNLGSLAAIPIALALGAILGFGVVGACAVRRRLLAGPHVRRPRVTAVRHRATAILQARASAIALSLAGRGPPAMSAR